MTVRLYNINFKCLGAVPKVFALGTKPESISPYKLQNGLLLVCHPFLLISIIILSRETVTHFEPLKA